MAKSSIKDQGRTMLRGSRENAKAKLLERAVLGKALYETNIADDDALHRLKDAVDRWNKFNEQLLNNIFTTDEMEREYSFEVGVLSLSVYNLYYETEKTQKEIMRKVNILHSIIERIDLFDEAASRVSEERGASESGSAPKMSNSANKVFIVHGRAELPREKVARLIEKLKLTPIILGEQPSLGQTIIEKIESNSDVSFAVILLTGDDVGSLAGEESQAKPRARQNVILELGYFVGLLKRGNVCVLYEEGVDLPSDILGVGYVALDKEDAWRLKLGKEMKAAGLNVDMNDV